MGAAMALRLALLGLALASLLGGAPATDVPSDASVHTVIPTECSKYMLWQSVAFYASFQRVGQPGAFTRLMCCAPADLAGVSSEELGLMPTHVAPSYTFNPSNGDPYLPYNKPVAVMDWLARVDVREEYVIVVDVDTILRAPLLPHEYGVRPGLVVAAHFDYLHGTHNDLAARHLPGVAPRQDELAGPARRRADMVGGLYMATREDLRRIAPLWLKYTEDVRMDPDAWQLVGEPGLQPGARPWISEMYGYSFAAAALNIWHRAEGGIMIYPGYHPYEPPKALHYGLTWNYSATQTFNKHQHMGFDILACPPWQLGASGLLPHPPHPRTLRSRGGDLVRDLLAMEPILAINAAACQVHWKRCSLGRQLFWECTKAEKLYKAFDVAWREAAA